MKQADAFITRTDSVSKVSAKLPNGTIVPLEDMVNVRASTIESRVKSLLGDGVVVDIHTTEFKLGMTLEDWQKYAKKIEQ